MRKKKSCSGTVCWLVGLVFTGNGLFPKKQNKNNQERGLYCCNAFIKTLALAWINLTTD